MDKLKKTLDSLLVRFITSHSIDIVDASSSIDTKKKSGKLTLSIPNHDKTKKNREAWDKDRRCLPSSGIIFPDGSIMTVFFQCSAPPIPGVLDPICKQITFEENDEVVAYVNA